MTASGVRLGPDEWTSLDPEEILHRLDPVPHRRVCSLAAAIQEFDTAALARRQFPERVLRDFDYYLDRLRGFTIELRRMANQPPTGWQLYLELWQVIKELAIDIQDFETAASVRDEQDRLRRLGGGQFAEHLRLLCRGWMQRLDPDTNYRGPVLPRPGLIDPDRAHHIGELMRDVLFDLGQPVAFPARWRTTDVMGVARGIANEHAFDRLPVLADALMDGDDEFVVGHCRGIDPHVPGCWVVDRILGKD